MPPKPGNNSSSASSNSLFHDDHYHRRGSIIAITEPTIPQDTSWEATSVVWTNAFGRGAFTHPGHAALCLRKAKSLTPDFTEVEKFRWVSFMPEVGRNPYGMRAGKFTTGYYHDIKFELGRAEDRLQNREFAPRHGQVVVGHDFYGYEKGEETLTEDWATVADKFVSMPAMDISKWGISLNRIVDWCATFWSSQACYYDFISNTNNCASVVWSALTAGGGKAFAEIHSNCPNHKVYITPSEFNDYCVRVREGILKVNQAAEYVCTTYNDKSTSSRDIMSAAPIGWNETDLYKLADWKRESAVSFKARGLILRRIDEALLNYHKYTWDANYNEKLLELLNIIIALRDHFLASKSGKRDAALCALAKQVFKVQSDMGAECLRSWCLGDFYDQVSPEYDGLQRAAPRGKRQEYFERMANRANR